MNVLFDPSRLGVTLLKVSFDWTKDDGLVSNECFDPPIFGSKFSTIDLKDLMLSAADFFRSCPSLCEDLQTDRHRDNSYKVSMAVLSSLSSCRDRWISFELQ